MRGPDRSDEHEMARNGKIAKLPIEIRVELDKREILRLQLENSRMQAAIERAGGPTVLARQKAAEERLAREDAGE